jgi:hypothetical protein
MKKWMNYGIGFVAMAMLGGCATAPGSTAPTDASSNLATQSTDPATKSVASKLSESVAINDAIAKADVAYKTNQADKATALLKEAAVAYPDDKMPWLRIAQAKFDSGNYIEAIVNAQQVLNRDAKDQVAKSIIVVSGLRLSTKALADLRTQNEISGSLRNEAQDLAKILRENLGESVLVSKHHKPVSHKKTNVQAENKEAAAQKSATAVKSSDSGNPFGALK